MKHLLYSLLVMCFIFISSSCNDEIVKTLEGQFIALNSSENSFLFLRVGDNQPVDLGAKVDLIAAPQSSPINYSFEIIDSLSNAIPNLHYIVESNSGTIPANETSSLLPIMVLPDNIELEEELTLAVKLTSADIDLANDDPVVYSIGVTCESELSGGVNYSHSDNFVGTTLTGSTTISLAGITPGVYKFGDFSFGAWKAAYDIDPPGGNLVLNHICGVVSYSGTDNYGDNWTIEEILESDGPNFTFRWSNTFDEFGTVTLVRQDGTDWPQIRI